MSEPRPNPTTMEGMIWNANQVLEQALKPNINGLPKGLFEKAIGIIFTHTIEAGLIFSGTAGSGIALAKTENGWSPPCAVGLGGLNFGLLGGLSASDVIVFVFDEETMKSLSAKHGLALGASVEATVGPWGRKAQLTDNIGDKKVGTTLSLAFSKGAFAGFEAKGAKLGAREFANNKFYNVVTTPEDIFTGKVAIPAGKVTMLDGVYDKLEKISKGATEEPDPAEEAKKASAKAVADQEAEIIKNSPEAEVVEVGASVQ